MHILPRVHITAESAWDGWSGGTEVWGESRHCRLVAHGQCASPSANSVGRRDIRSAWRANGGARRYVARAQLHTRLRESALARDARSRPSAATWSPPAKASRASPPPAKA